MSKNGFIQIPNSIIRNKDIGSKEFLLILILKYQYYINGNKDELSFDMKKLKLNLNINDNRTIKKIFSNLHKKYIIQNEIEVKSNTPVTVKLNIELLQSKPFTQLPSKLLDQVYEIDAVGIHLLYYYESYIIRSQTQNQYCFVSMIKVMDDLGLAKNTIIKFNDILVKNKLLKIVRHKLETEYDYNDKDELIFNKYNNHYYVRV